MAVLDTEEEMMAVMMEDTTVVLTLVETVAVEMVVVEMVVEMVAVETEKLILQLAKY